MRLSTLTTYRIEHQKKPGTVGAGSGWWHEPHRDIVTVDNLDARLTEARKEHAGLPLRVVRRTITEELPAHLQP